MKKLRILIWCPYVNPGGGARLLGRFVAAASRQSAIGGIRLAIPSSALADVTLSGCRDPVVEVLPLHDRRPPGRWRGPDTPNLGNPRTRWLKQAVRERLQRGRARELVRCYRRAEDGTDLVYVFWPHRQQPPPARRPVVCTIQDLTLLTFPEILGGHQARREWALTARWLALAARVVVSSAATAETLRRFFPSANEPLIVRHAIAPLAVQSSLAAPRPPVVTGEYLLYPANITAHKNHTTLLRAWSLLPRRDHISLVLCGAGTEVLRLRPPDWPDDWQAARLVATVHRLGLREGRDFHALGFVSDEELYSLLYHAKALVMPSLAEGGGSFPVEEALTLGVPVICSDLPVMREHLAQRSAPVVWFDPESASALVAAIEHVLKHYAELKQGAERGRHDPRPTWDEIASLYVDIFREVVRD